MNNKNLNIIEEMEIREQMRKNAQTYRDAFEYYRLSKILDIERPEDRELYDEGKRLSDYLYDSPGVDDEL